MKVKQIRYYGDGDSRNSMSNTENLLDDTYNEIQIKAYPGTEVEINGESILIGEIGIYNISYEDGIEITSLSIDDESLSHIDGIQLAYIVITLTQYDKETEGETGNNTGTNTQEQSGTVPIIPEEEPQQSDSQEEIVKDNHDSRL